MQCRKPGEGGESSAWGIISLRVMNFFIFTPQESKAVIFLVVILLLGSGVTLYKKYHPDFAPELLLRGEWSRESKVKVPAKSSTVKENENLIPSEGKINLNTATLKELEFLPGIGKELGKRILDYRERQGGFSNIEELQKIKGIGPKTFDKLKNLVSTE
jgi:comEA protein